jgi:hypothetical protein
VALAAARSEGARHSEEDHLLTGTQLAQVHLVIWKSRYALIKKIPLYVMKFSINMKKYI